MTTKQAMLAAASPGALPVEFWYDFGSNYSYLSVMRISALARARRLTIVWRPFLLGPLFASFGWNDSPFVLQKEKGVYVWADMARESAKYALAFQRPSQFPRTAVLATRVALLGADEPWIGEFSERIMQANFAHDRDIGSAALVGAVLDELGLPAARLIDAAQSDENKAHLRSQVNHARSLGLFGAPTFMVGTEMFWGNDRLLDALDCAHAAHGGAQSGAPSGGTPGR